MFSVVIPLYNKEDSIFNTIKSVLSQSFKEFEVVVVNDGSIDNSLNIVQSINDPRIRIINQKNQGVSAARNRGVSESRYEWIAFLDGDDFWENNHLLEIKSMMNLYPGREIFATSFAFSDNRKVFKHPRSSKVFEVQNYFKEAQKEYLLWTSVVVVSKVAFLEIGGFDINLDRGEDLDLWLKFARKYKIVKSYEITATYRIEAENRSDLSFKLKKSRVYNYDFSSSLSKDETLYVKSQIINSLLSFVYRGDLRSFFLLKRKHKKYISYIDIIKSRL